MFLVANRSSPVASVERFEAEFKAARFKVEDVEERGMATKNTKNHENRMSVAFVERFEAALEAARAGFDHIGGVAVFAS